MTDEIKRIDIREFRERGYVHEVNRLVLHPLGLALEVQVDKETGEERLGGVWDYRDDPEGIVYGDDLLSADKAAYVAEAMETKGLERLRECGFVVQPVDPGVKQLKVSVLEPTLTRIGPPGADDEGEELSLDERFTEDA